MLFNELHRESEPENGIVMTNLASTLYDLDHSHWYAYDNKFIILPAISREPIARWFDEVYSGHIGIIKWGLDSCGWNEHGMTGVRIAGFDMGFYNGSSSDTSHYHKAIYGATKGCKTLKWIIDSNNRYGNRCSLKFDNTFEAVVNEHCVPDIEAYSVWMKFDLDKGGEK